MHGCTTDAHAHTHTHYNVRGCARCPTKMRAAALVSPQALTDSEAAVVCDAVRCMAAVAAHLRKRSLLAAARKVRAHASVHAFPRMHPCMHHAWVKTGLCQAASVSCTHMRQCHWLLAAGGSGVQRLIWAPLPASGRCAPGPGREKARDALRPSSGHILRHGCSSLCCRRQPCRATSAPLVLACMQCGCAMHALQAVCSSHPATATTRRVWCV